MIRRITGLKKLNGRCFLVNRSLKNETSIEKRLFSDEKLRIDNDDDDIPRKPNIHKLSREERLKQLSNDLFKMMSLSTKVGKIVFDEKKNSEEEILKWSRAIFGLDDVEAKKCALHGRTVLNLCISDYLYGHFKNLNSDQLNSILYSFTSKDHIIDISRSLNIHMFLQNRPNDLPYLYVGLDEYNAYMVSTFFRMVGAIYLKNGLAYVRDFIAQSVLKKSVDLSLFLESFDPKVELHELVRTGKAREFAGKEISYKPVQAEKKKNFLNSLRNLSTNVGVFIDSEEEPYAIGEGLTKQIAENNAAQNALFKYYLSYSKEFTPIQKELIAKKKSKKK